MYIDIDKLIADIRKTAYNAGKTVSKMADQSSKKTEEMIEYTKLKLKIIETEGEIKDLYEAVGRKLYSARSDDTQAVPDFTQDFEALDGLKINAATLRERAETFKKRKKCPECGRQNDRNAVFCQGCGVRF